MKYALKTLLAAVLTAGTMLGQAAVVQIEDANSTAYSNVFGTSPTLTFSETGALAANPTFVLTPTGYAATSSVAGATPFISFGSYFIGQTFTQNLADCEGGLLSATTTKCVNGRPSAGLTLAPSGTAAIVTDGAFGAGAGGIVLAGATDFGFGDPIAMLFDTSVSAVSFLAGGFNNIGSTRVQVFSRDGEVLATVFNPGVCPEVPGDPTATPPVPARPGICPPDPIRPQLFTFAFSSSVNEIAGILISVRSIEEAGFSIDNVRTVTTTTTSSNGSTGSSGGQVPEPTSLALVGLALIGLGFARRRRA